MDKQFSSTVQGVVGFIMTLIKPLWGILIVYLMESSYPRIFIAAVIVAVMIWDNVNGVLFRRSWLAKYIWLKRVRRLIDAGGDRFIIHFVLIMMIVITQMPPAFYLLVLFREVILCTTVIWCSFKLSDLSQPNWWSKSGTVFIGLTSISWLLVGPIACMICLASMFILSGLGIRQYILAPQPIKA